MKKPAALALIALAFIAHAQVPNPDKVKLQKAEKLYSATKMAWTKDKNNVPKRKSYVKATVSLGTIVMTSPLLGPKAKYPRALKLYREALRLDPKNKEALQNKRMIEDIYRSMNRPIPQ